MIEQWQIFIRNIGFPCFHCACCFLPQAAAETNPLNIRQLSVFIGVCYSNITLSYL